MKNIEHVGSDSLEALSNTGLSASKQRKLKTEIICAMISIACLIIGLLYQFFVKTDVVVAPLCFTIGFLVEGVPVIWAAIKGIFSKDLTNAMEMLVAIAIVACYLSGDLVLSVLIPLILNLTHFLEERSIVGGRDIIDGLRRLQQNTATVLEGDERVVVDVKKLTVGQHILIKPGEHVPIDGVIISGDSHVDQKSLTGEPEPVDVKPGSPVYAGTVNLDGQLIVEVQKEFVDTSFSHILSFLEKAERISVPESRIIDRFMRYYIPFVLAIAGAVALFTGDLSKAIAILVVSCPCGQMLVSSAPMIAALSVATRRGIVIKNSKFIEDLNEIDAVVFDKTGTITKGNLELTDVHPADTDTTKETLLAVAYALASGSNHPVSQAVLNSVDETAVTKVNCGEVKELPGKGMEAVLPEGQTIRFGNYAWLSEQGIVIPDAFREQCVGSVSYVAQGDRLLGALCFSDTPREEAKQVIEQLRDLGVKQFVMLTGDRSQVAERICAETGIDEFRAQLLPEEKLSAIQELKATQKVIAVGDGINDALALKEAHVGVAMGAMGSDLAVQSADVALMSDNLLNLPFSITLARKTRNVIYQNLVLSLLISFTMILLSSFGVISVLAGSILHNVGAFTVILNSSKILKLNKN